MVSWRRLGAQPRPSGATAVRGAGSYASVHQSPQTQLKNTAQPKGIRLRMPFLLYFIHLTP